MPTIRATAGVREAKNRFSEYLRRVRKGAVVSITDRGVVVAELRPPEPSAASTYDRMVQDGQILPARRKVDRSLFDRSVRRRGIEDGYAARLIDEGREERS